MPNGINDLFSVLSGATSGGTSNPSTPSSSVASGDPAANRIKTGGQQQQPSSGVWPGIPSMGGPGAGMGGMFGDIAGRMPGMMRAMNNPAPNGGMSPVNSFAQGMKDMMPQGQNDWWKNIFRNDPRFQDLRNQGGSHPFNRSVPGNMINPGQFMPEGANPTGKLISPDDAMARNVYGQTDIPRPIYDPE